MGAGAIQLDTVRINALSVPLGEGDGYQSMQEDRERDGRTFGQLRLHGGGAVRGEALTERRTMDGPFLRGRRTR